MEHMCPLCSGELAHEDTFGNTDWCLDAIGYHRDFYPRGTPKKYGDIYWCEKCEENYFTFDDDLELRRGYPC